MIISSDATKSSRKRTFWPFSGEKIKNFSLGGRTSGAPLPNIFFCKILCLGVVQLDFHSNRPSRSLRISFQQGFRIPEMLESRRVDARPVYWLWAPFGCKWRKMDQTFLFFGLQRCRHAQIVGFFTENRLETTSNTVRPVVPPHQVETSMIKTQESGFWEENTGNPRWDKSRSSLNKINNSRLGGRTSGTPLPNIFFCKISCLWGVQLDFHQNRASSSLRISFSTGAPNTIKAGI